MHMHIHIHSDAHKSVCIYEHIQRVENYPICFNALNLGAQSFHTLDYKVETLLKGTVHHRNKIKHHYPYLSAYIFLSLVLFI